MPRLLLSEEAPPSAAALSPALHHWSSVNIHAVPHIAAAIRPRSEGGPDPGREPGTGWMAHAKRRRAATRIVHIQRGGLHGSPQAVCPHPARRDLIGAVLSVPAHAFRLDYPLMCRPVTPCASTMALVPRRGCVRPTSPACATTRYAPATVTHEDWHLPVLRLCSLDPHHCTTSGPHLQRQGQRRW